MSKCPLLKRYIASRHGGNIVHIKKLLLRPGCVALIHVPLIILHVVPHHDKKTFSYNFALSFISTEISHCAKYLDYYISTFLKHHLQPWCDKVQTSGFGDLLPEFWATQSVSATSWLGFCSDIHPQLLDFGKTSVAFPTSNQEKFPLVDSNQRGSREMEGTCNKCQGSKQRALLLKSMRCFSSIIFDEFAQRC